MTGPQSEREGESAPPSSGWSGPRQAGHRGSEPANTGQPHTSQPPAGQHHAGLHHAGQSQSGDQRRPPEHGARGGGNGPGNSSRPGPRHTSDDGKHAHERDEIYGALDLGTNNCRLLLARPTRRGFRVVDAFSRIIRLGEGVSQTGHLSDAAMDRTAEALRICAAKLARANVQRARCVATEACRIARNGSHFLDRVRRDLGLDIEILSRESEANLAVSGCASLIDFGADYVLVFDIGGGSSELIWLDVRTHRDGGHAQLLDHLDRGTGIAAWTSLPAGVVTLAERHGGRHVTPQSFEDMVQEVISLIAPFEAKHRFRERTADRAVHFLGTSGTVTTVAGIRLGLKRYDRSRVDGCWLSADEVQDVTDDLLSRSYDERVAEPCIGQDRADLVLAGCAILEAILRVWPADRLRVADRGLREGILTKLMTEDTVYRAGRRRRNARRHER